MRRWASALALAAPVGALFFAARWTDGWMSIAAWVFFVSAIGLITWGVVLEGKSWSAGDAEFDGSRDTASGAAASEQTHAPELADRCVMRELDVVRVVRLLQADRRFDGTPGVSRPPQVGDEGTIVHDHGEAVRHVEVEMVAPDGYTIWLATFDRCELELVIAYDPPLP